MLEVTLQGGPLELDGTVRKVDYAGTAPFGLLVEDDNFEQHHYLCELLAQKWAGTPSERTRL